MTAVVPVHEVLSMAILHEKYSCAGIFMRLSEESNLQ